MDTNWAADHLQAIRTLMQRSALYRRTLAPVMIVSGALGTAGALGAHIAQAGTVCSFSLFWLGIGSVTLAASFLLVRRQALKDHEPFWSPPTRRVTTSLLPAFLIGLAAGAGDLFHERTPPWIVAAVWLTTYGCALHAAGFFMQRGIRLFSWIFVFAGCALLLGGPSWPRLQASQTANYLMGFFFGLLHLSYGVYLYFTEKHRDRP